ncbi:MAG: hypothetical protein QG621_633, partial [Patescibacteria group bacterium]|nr:hypothetical protein [Patescibacteria group bacterium]
TLYWKPATQEKSWLNRSSENPVLGPDPSAWWESEAVFNPAAFVHEGKIHLLYRAIGSDGVSRIGYAMSDDGVHFTRHREPAYDPSGEMLRRAAESRKRLSYTPLSYSPVNYGSGGGWGGSEDPRAVIIDGELHMTFTSFEGWSNVRIMMTTMSLENLSCGLFNWSNGVYLSPPGEVQKNWVLFPEKIKGRFALMHNIYPTVEIAYFTQKQIEDGEYICSRFAREARKGAWDTYMRGAGAPPLKTPEGWLLLYHAVDEKEPHKYKVGALLLDLADPTKVLYRSDTPILEPDHWYENDWKPGVVYASGAVIFNGELIVYYGGGDKYIAAAKANLNDFLYKLTHHQQAVLQPVA